MTNTCGNKRSVPYTSRLEAAAEDYTSAAPSPLTLPDDDSSESDHHDQSNIDNCKVDRMEESIMLTDDRLLRHERILSIIDTALDILSEDVILDAHESPALWLGIQE